MDLPYTVKGTEKDIDFSKLEFIKNPNPPKMGDPETLEFGRTFSAHMLEIDWQAENGFSVPRIVPYHNFKMHPATTVLHYAVTCFEGMKAYKSENGEVVMFRPLDNCNRLLSSARRLALPDWNPEELLKCIKELVWIDRDYIPDRRGYSMYIRPTIIGTDACLGLRNPSQMKIYVICSPVGPYYKTGFKAVGLLAMDKYARAWKGGTGWAKLGANYGITLSVNKLAYEEGYQQILWLYKDKKYITEVGTMNFMCYWINEDGEKEIITAPLSQKVILDGITRRSIIAIAKKWGIKVNERKWTIHELIKAVNENRVLECFGTGTAAIISPVKEIKYGDTVYKIPVDPEDEKATIGPLAKKFLNEIQDIQYGKVESEWSVNLTKERKKEE